MASGCGDMEYCFRDHRTKRGKQVLKFGSRERFVVQ